MDPRTDWHNILDRDPDWEDTVERLDIMAADGSIPPSLLIGPTHSAFYSMLLADKNAPRQELTAPLLTLYNGSLERAFPSTPYDVIGLACAGMLLASCGVDLDPVPMVERAMADVLADEALEGAELFTSLSLAAAALGLDDVVGELVGVDEVYVAESAFGPDAQGYARAVVAAAAAGASGVDFGTTWTSAAAFFPPRQAAGGLQWSDLLFMAWPVYTRLNRQPPREVFAELHVFIRALAKS